MRLYTNLNCISTGNPNRISVNSQLFYHVEILFNLHFCLSMNETFSDTQGFIDELPGRIPAYELSVHNMLSTKQYKNYAKYYIRMCKETSTNTMRLTYTLPICTSLL